MALESRSPAPAPNFAEKPVVGILTIDDETNDFRGNRSNFADLIRTGESMGFVTYVITVKNWKLNSPRVLGYTCRREDGTWVKEWYPRPTVIYNRIPLREDERLPNVKRKLDLAARHPGVRLFNRRFFNKWSLYQWLYRHPTTRPYIPETTRLSGAPELARLLKRHRALYLKPVRGKAGVGIMSVRLQPEKVLPYRLQIQEEKGSRTFRFSSLKRLWLKIADYSLQTGESYIVQQAIQLAAAGDRPFDLRILAQKNITGRWELTGIGARVAGSSSITTHVPRGGNIDDPHRLLTSVFGKEQAAKVLANVQNAILLLAKQIERACGSRLAEMSMDLGVDYAGNVWFFEANSKPMKFDEPHIRSKSLQRIFQYSLYLHRRAARKSGR